LFPGNYTPKVQIEASLTVEKEIFRSRDFLSVALHPSSFELYPNNEE
jgi:hypothetical protein